MLGFDAVGRLALGQISQSYGATTTNLGGVAGGGVAGLLTSKVGAGLVGVAGGGVAGALTAKVAISIIGVVGGGVAGSLVAKDSTGLVGVAGGGVAGSLIAKVSAFLLGVSGGGVVGSFIPTVTVNFLGVSGGGVAGQIGAQPSGVPSGVAGHGVAGDIRIVISGGGGDERLPAIEEPKRRDKRIKTGLLPLDQRPSAPKPPPKKPLLPPIDDAPSLVPTIRPPLPEIQPAAVDALEEIWRQIISAEASSTLTRLQLEQDEQDAADIADVLALLD